MLTFRISSETSFLQETVIALPVKNDVIKKLNANDLSGLLDLLGGINVRLRWLKSSLRVVMRHDDARSSVCQRISKDFTRMYWAAIY